MNLSGTVIWQISLMTMTVIVQAIILGRLSPFSEDRTAYEFYSEATVMVVMYHMICFTPFIPEVETRFYLGYLCIVVVCQHLFVSFYIIGKQTYREARILYLIR